MFFIAIRFVPAVPSWYSIAFSLHADMMMMILYPYLMIKHSHAVPFPKPVVLL